MKKKILNNIIKNIKKNNKDITEEKLEIIEYGLESIYLTIFKIIIILLLAIILDIFKETILTLVFYNIIRFFAFGMHSKKSSHCLIMSLIFFIGGTYLGIYLNIPLYIKISLSIFSVLLISIYAPADTKKRPLINKKKRLRFKILSIIASSTLTILIIYFRNNPITNFMLLGLIEATIMILPITYKIFGLPYNNYKTFKKV